MNDEKNLLPESINTELVPTTPVAPKKRARPQPKTQLPSEPILAVPTLLTADDKRKKELKEKIVRQREENARLVTGKFLFNECPGGRLKFAYREFPGEPLCHYDMIHGTIHTIPLGVARHLNERCSYPEYQHNLDQGKAVDAKNMYVMTRVNRTNFIPLDFTMDAGYSPNGVSQVTFTNPMSSTQNLLGS